MGTGAWGCSIHMLHVAAVEFVHHPHYDFDDYVHKLLLQL
jgi:hypothetical protein